MMGTDHALGGVAAGLATLSWCPHPDVGHQAAWVAAWTGAALLPDWDSSRSMASRMWGPASGLVHEGVSALGGGHRGLTHDLLLAPVLAFAAVTAASQSQVGRMITVAIVLGLAARVLLVRSATWFTALCTIAVSGVGAWWIVEHNLDLGAGLPLCIVGGILVHLAGDAITVARLPMPIAWIFGSRAKLGIGLFQAGKTFEKTIVAPAHLVLIGWLAQRQYGWFGTLQLHIHP